METFKNKKGQPIGWLKEGIFRKKVKESKHLLRMMDGWGIDKSVVQTLGACKCTEIRIKCEEKQVVYSIPFDDFMDHSVERDFGDSPQLFVSRKYFSTDA